MNFAATQLLSLLIIIPLAGLLLWWVAFRRRQLLARLGDGALLARLSELVNHNGRLLRSILYLLALALTIIALARPQWGFDEETVEQQGVQIMVALDVSPSMLAEDIAPNRLLRARQEIADLMDLLGGDEIGLVLFSGAAFIQFPLTTDYNTAQSFLESATPSAISRPGTVLGEAILTAMAGFNADRTSQKVILILTDGEDHETDPLAAAQTAAADNVVIYTIGFGSDQGEPIPLYNQLGQSAGFLQDNAGNMVLTRLDDGILRQVASVTNGRYFQASSVGNLANDIASELDRLEQTSLESRTERIAIERFQIFLLVAVITLFAIPLISERKKALNQAVVAFAAIWLLTGCVSNEAQLVQAGNTAFEATEYETAVSAYLDAENKAPELAEPTYNIANTYYRQGGYEEAQSFLAASLERARETVAQWGFFNRGNAAYQLGDAETAVSAYKDALRHDPSDLDAKHNLELALQLLQDQQAQQQQEQQQEQESSEEEQEQDGEGEEESESEEESSESQESEEPLEQPSESEAQEGEQSESGAEAQPSEQLTEEQALRLLEAIEQNTETLQEYLGLRYQGDGRPPDKGW
ncbi:MAG: VWA domain-containing protein [Chloroflexota bacterium]